MLSRSSRGQESWGAASMGTAVAIRLDEARRVVVWRLWQDVLL